jgi:hypothetical protein
MQTHTAYPVHLEVQSPPSYDRVQLLLRVLICFSIGIVHQSVGGLAGVLYLVLPTLAAILISQRTGRGYLDHDATWLSAVLDWVVAFYAYMLFVTDRFPLERASRPAHLFVTLPSEADHSPSLSDALMRLLTSVPHAILLGLLGLVAVAVSLISAAFILFTLHVPEVLRGFQRDYVGWLGRVLAYHASLVDVYPPFSLNPQDAGPRGALAP